MVVVGVGVAVVVGVVVVVAVAVAVAVGVAVAVAVGVGVAVVVAVAMSTEQEVRRAAEMLRAHAHEDAVTVWLQPDAYGTPLVVLTKPLADLIEAAAEPDDINGIGLEHSAGWCKICGGPQSHHKPDCALMALVRAINGEGA